MVAKHLANFTRQLKMILSINQIFKIEVSAFYKQIFIFQISNNTFKVRQMCLIR
jgi:hypothetical protein